MPECKYCSVESRFELCYDHHLERLDNLINPCKCGMYKDVEDDLCQSCSETVKSSNAEEKMVIQ